MERSTVEHITCQIRSKGEFELIFNTFYSHLCSYANGFLKDLDASEEIVQEVMLKVWINRENLAITSSIQSYLLRAVRNGCLNLLKHVSIREAYKSFKEREDTTWQRSHEEEMMVTELEMKIRQAIEKLPVERRRVFILSRYDGLTYREIANKLG
ncbi:MAG: RNA polymerase sigma-70 factor, partial [Bacteroidales bacterium]|nr:RNA polymerase sigma-70 factor [Bacteroidales bacterium]